MWTIVAVVIVLELLLGSWLGHRLSRRALVPRAPAARLSA